MKLTPKNIAYLAANAYALKVAHRRQPKPVFLHIPKCAGSSITSRLRQQYGPSSCRGNLSHHDWGHILSHGRLSARPRRLQRYRSYAGHFGPDFIDILEEPLFLFTFLRDPAARIVSFYNFLCSKESPFGGPYGSLMTPLMRKVQGMNLETFLQTDDPEVIKGTHNTMTWQLAFGYHHREVLSGIDETELLERAKATLERMDFIGFYENLEEDFRRLQERLGIRILPLSGKNITPDSYKLSVQEQLRSKYLEQHITLDRQLYEWARSKRKAI
ncbi:MAG: Sulfotransferase family protein [Candidatus Kentron sp. G]|nr:MAG: Sulfotransferase family protein [Candidatus Kentron sp. G]VFN00239.1 MAG: Sulfotransferase family protein [Candidatus Kentron sp. G]VFN02326.1 MAG: Sulfotransferase family protein [Candidatus Kentron sp. G]